MSRQMEQSEYWRGALVMGLGGGLFVFAALHLAQLFASIGSGRILTSGFPFFSLFFAMLIMFLVSRWVLRSFVGWSKQRAARATWLWLALYIVMLVFGRLAGGVNLIIYAAGVLLLGGGAAFLLPPNYEPKGKYKNAAQFFQQDKKAQGASPQRHQVVQRSEFGRVTTATVVLLTKTIRQTTGEILATLPQAMPLGLRNATIKMVLDVIYQDWWENGNDEGLRPVDVADLQSFVNLALTLSGFVGPHQQQMLNDPLAQAVYRATLRALLDDWLEYWNDNGVEGPPSRY